MGNAKQIILENGEPTEQPDEWDIQEGEIVEAPPAEKSTTVQPTTPQSTALVASASGQISPESLRGMIAYETEIRGIVKEYLAKNMVAGVDHDRIHVGGKDCPHKYDVKNCPNDKHFSKATLLKPGAEKFTALFKLNAVFRRDDDTWEMAGKPAGLFCYVCELRSADGKILSEGRGACSPQEKMDNMNSAIKIAQKRAQVDATLRFGALSDIFTQDMEDLPATEEPSGKNRAPQVQPAKPATAVKPATPPAPVKPAVVPTTPPVPKLTEEEKVKIADQKREINKLCLEYNPMLTTAADYMTHVKQITGLELSVKNYAVIIEKLRAKPPSPERQKMVESVRKVKAPVTSPT